MWKEEEKFFLKLVQRIARALLIIVIAVGVTAAGLLLNLALPHTTGRLWATAGQDKVF